MTEQRTTTALWRPRRSAVVCLLAYALATVSASRALGQQSASDEGALRRSGFGSQPRLLADPFQEPRQLLRLLDIGPSQFSSFVDGQAISPIDEEALVKILFRMPQIDLADIERWLHRQVPWEALAVEPTTRRGDFFLLEGRAREITLEALRPRMAGLFEFEHYYQVRIELTGPTAGDSPRSVLVCARSIPRAWQDLRQLNQPCRVLGMFLKRVADHNQLPQLLFAASRIAWLPDRVDPRLGVDASDVLLARLGMDVGLLDSVRMRNGLPLSASERECFYALLSTAHKASPQQLARLAQPLQLGSLLQHPERAHGHLLKVRGTLQRITKVLVEEADIQQRLGINHYYQLDTLVAVGETPVEVRGEDKNSKGPLYRDSFPLTCCCLTIPRPWQHLVGRDQVSQEAELTGFFYKLWAFPNPYVASFDPRQRQLSPMLMLREPVPLEVRTDSYRWLSIFAGTGFLLVLLAVWGLVVRLGRSDRQFGNRWRQRRLNLDERPDFQPLEELDK